VLPNQLCAGEAGNSTAPSLQSFVVKAQLRDVAYYFSFFDWSRYEKNTAKTLAAHYSFHPAVLTHFYRNTAHIK